jgi:hypothetical protein
MSYYEPSWSAEEQTMVDLMVLSGFGVVPDINREYSAITLIPAGVSRSIIFRADTEYEAIRKAFNHWNKLNA